MEARELQLRISDFQIWSGNVFQFLRTLQDGHNVRLETGIYAIVQLETQLLHLKQNLQMELREERRSAAEIDTV